MLKSSLNRFCFLLVMLHLHGAAAGSEFVTAGLPYAVEPAPVVAQSIWFAQPAGQEFVSALPRVDFIDLQLYQGVMPPGTSNHYKVILRADTITGPFVWASETVARPEFDVSVARFFFDPPVTLSPWARYVFELVREEPIEGWQDAPGVGFVLDWPVTNPAWHYSGGRAVWEGAPVEDADMYFRAGVMMPPMFSTNAVLVTATGLPKLADPGAAFTNQLISSLNGSTLECRMDTPLGTNNDLQFNPVLVHVDPVSQVLSVPYNGGFQSVGVVLTNVPGDRSALVVRFTTDAPTYVVGLVLGGVELLARPNPLNAPWPAVRTNTLRVTFRHEAGEVTEAMRVDFQERNRPPAAYVWINKIGGFLGPRPALFTRREQAKTEVALTMLAFDPDSTTVFVQWQKNGSNEVAGTNVVDWLGKLRPGLYTFGGTVRDEENKVTATPVTFEVLTPRQGVQRLRAAVRDEVSTRRRRLVEEPLIFAEQAIRQRQWTLAESYLRAFQRRVGRLVPDEELHGVLNNASRVLIDEALARPTSTN